MIKSRFGWEVSPGTTVTLSKASSGRPHLTHKISCLNQAHNALDLWEGETFQEKAGSHESSCTCEKTPPFRFEHQSETVPGRSLKLLPAQLHILARKSLSSLAGNVLFFFSLFFFFFFFFGMVLPQHLSSCSISGGCLPAHVPHVQGTGEEVVDDIISTVFWPKGQGILLHGITSSVKTKGSQFREVKHTKLNKLQLVGK